MSLPKEWNLQVSGFSATTKKYKLISCTNCSKNTKWFHQGFQSQFALLFEQIVRPCQVTGDNGFHLYRRSVTCAHSLYKLSVCLCLWLSVWIGLPHDRLALFVEFITRCLKRFHQIASNIQTSAIKFKFTNMNKTCSKKSKIQIYST